MPAETSCPIPPALTVRAATRETNRPFDGFREVWLVEFQSRRQPGDRPTPLGLTACQYGGPLRVEHENLWEPPYPTGSDALFVAYDAPAALACHLALGWPLPARILDLQAEFRCLTSGLDVPAGYDLAGALAHYRLGGDGVDALGRLLEVMRPSLDLPRALLRGRYTAAVARMEAVGVPIDVASLARLRGGWQTVQDALLVEADAGGIEGVVAACQRAMAWASGEVLRGFRLRAEAKVVRHPDRYADPRGQAMWDTVFGLLDREGVPRCA